MNIGILTHHLGINYGGILQCYALSATLQRMGHTPVVIQREPNSNWKTPLRLLLQHFGLLRYLERTDRADGSRLRPFIRQHICLTPPIRSRAKMLSVSADHELKAVIVGSDQVWRKEFVDRWRFEYYLDFVPTGVKRLSYAASIGVDTWDYSPTDSAQIASHLRQFTALSVRESQAAHLLQTELDIKACVMPDPTLLLSADDYRALMTNASIPSQPYVFAYWLNPDKSALEELLRPYREAGKHIVIVSLHQTSALPSVEEWLALVAHADAVITDSFHGIVFSFIFERPLRLHCNAAGGFSRISSLLTMLGCPELADTPNAPIDRQLVSRNIQEWQVRAHTFLHAGLNAHNS